MLGKIKEQRSEAIWECFFFLFKKKTIFLHTNSELVFFLSFFFFLRLQELKLGQTSHKQRSDGVKMHSLLQPDLVHSTRQEGEKLKQPSEEVLKNG